MDEHPFAARAEVPGEDVPVERVHRRSGPTAGREHGGDSSGTARLGRVGVQDVGPPLHNEPPEREDSPGVGEW